uniref:Uncharacterized protein n=1 Tax=Anguilla anguilla TaxID=7936 RepID=A0A0E9XXS8_ANGAN
MNLLFLIYMLKTPHCTPAKHYSN